MTTNPSRTRRTRRPSHSRRAAAVVVAALAVVPLAACGPAGATKAGPGGVPVTLTLATPEGRGYPYTSFVEDFARRVEEGTDGEVTVDIAWLMLPWDADAEHALVQLVQHGGVDLALIPARAFDLAGIHSLEGLQAPFVIEAPEVAAAAIDLPSVKGALEDLSASGIVGLAIALESMRHPAGYDKPILSLADFDGMGIRTPRSNTSSAIMASLGAHAGLSDSPYLDEDGGELRAAETGLAWIGSLPPDLIVTANMTFFPKFDVIAGSIDRLAGLDESQRAVLESAAQAAARTYTTVAAHEEVAASAFCAGGGRLAFATPEDVAGVRAASAPTLAALRERESTAALIDEVTALKRRTAVAPMTTPVTCLPPTGDGAGWPPPETGP